jgi:hypothetical protein
MCGENIIYVLDMFPFIVNCFHCFKWKLLYVNGCQEFFNGVTVCFSIVIQELCHGFTFHFPKMNPSSFGIHTINFTMILKINGSNNIVVALL